ncbi:DUF721 domain-containing protein [Patescibacteria group bacterium]|nr:DUF721 domain-containing protein [Patescibacteria group bacterium]
MERIEEILSKNYKFGTGFTKNQVLSLKVCDMWAGVLAEIDGRYVGESKAVKFKEGELTVNVASSAVMMELEMLNLIIVEEYEKVLEKELIKRIKYRLGRVG